MKIKKLLKKHKNKELIYYGYETKNDSLVIETAYIDTITINDSNISINIKAESGDYICIPINRLGTTPIEATSSVVKEYLSKVKTKLQHIMTTHEIQNVKLLSNITNEIQKFLKVDFVEMENQDEN